MRYKRWILMCAMAVCFAACDDDSNDADIPEDFLGWWSDANSSGVLIPSSDGYIYGARIDSDGSVTRSRTDVTTWTATAEDTSMFTITKADNGVFETSDGKTGTYELSTAFNQCLVPFISITPAGQQTMYFLLHVRLDGSDGCIGEGENGGNNQNDPKVCNLSKFGTSASVSPNSLFSGASPGKRNFTIAISSSGVMESLDGTSCSLTTSGGDGCDSYAPDFYQCGACEMQVWDVDGVTKIALESCADPGIPEQCLADFCDDIYGKVVYDISN
ncbi:MAG: hypothetical protein GY854_24005 [Deltaproteobacteria bacterium]|nr:hypothetical protein [Deltaproteobacteria bacterium]